jgi:hypothetical protein
MEGSKCSGLRDLILLTSWLFCLRNEVNITTKCKPNGRAIQTQIPQRRRGRDLFDIYWALTLAKPAVVPARIIESFQHYLKLEGGMAGRAEFVALLDGHLADRGFCSDMNQLLRAGIAYDPQLAGDHVKTKLLSLLPAR